jgi:hypothetical protein
MTHIPPPTHTHIYNLGIKAFRMIAKAYSNIFIKLSSKHSSREMIIGPVSLNGLEKQSTRLKYNSYGRRQKCEQRSDSQASSKAAPWRTKGEMRGYYLVRSLENVLRAREVVGTSTKSC